MQTPKQFRGSKFRRVADRVLPYDTRRRRFIVERARRLPFTQRWRSSNLRRTPPRPTGEVHLPTEVPHSIDPVVTIVIPVHGQLDMTCNCLWSLTRSRNSIPFEILVLDDASPDDSAAQLEKILGLRLIRLIDNVGFTRACNIAAAEAKTPYVVFLNNDTEVRDGWLDALHRVADSAADIGIVGARLLYPDGVLQEAGGVIFNDGTGWNYGRGFPGDDPRCLHRRSVDYVSGAALLIRKDLFDSVGMFDERYSPAYCEDSDLAFTVRSLGYRVVYEPNAVVVHYEGSSHGTDTSKGLKRYQVRNQSLLAAKWRAELLLHGEPTGPIDILRNFGSPPRILVVDEFVPSSEGDMRSRRMAKLLLLMQEMEYSVTLFPEKASLRTEGDVARMRSLGIEVIDGERKYQLHHAGTGFVLIIVSGLQTATRWIPALRRQYSNVPIVFDYVDGHTHPFTSEITSVPVDPTNAESVKAKDLSGIEADLMVVPTNSNVTIGLNGTPEIAVVDPNNVLMALQAFIRSHKEVLHRRPVRSLDHLEQH